MIRDARTQQFVRAGHRQWSTTNAIRNDDGSLTSGQFRYVEDANAVTPLDGTVYRSYVDDTELTTVVGYFVSL